MMPALFVLVDDCNTLPRMRAACAGGGVGRPAVWVQHARRLLLIPYFDHRVSRRRSRSGVQVSAALPSGVVRSGKMPKFPLPAITLEPSAVTVARSVKAL